MNRGQSVEYLTRCADRDGNHWSGGIKWPADECPTCHGSNNAGWLRVPCSRYGSTGAECAPAAYRVAYLLARESGDPVDRDGLDHAMSLVVNDHDDPAYIVREYGYRHW